MNTLIANFPLPRQVPSSTRKHGGRGADETGHFNLTSFDGGARHSAVLLSGGHKLRVGDWQLQHILFSVSDVFLHKRPFIQIPVLFVFIYSFISSVVLFVYSLLHDPAEDSVYHRNMCSDNFTSCHDDRSCSWDLLSHPITAKQSTLGETIHTGSNNPHWVKQSTLGQVIHTWSNYPHWVKQSTLVLAIHTGSNYPHWVKQSTLGQTIHTGSNNPHWVKPSTLGQAINTGSSNQLWAKQSTLGQRIKTRPSTQRWVKQS